MTMTGEEVRTRGLAALRRELGRAGLVRFLQHFQKGSGDYTQAREELMKDVTVDSLRRALGVKKTRRQRVGVRKGRGAERN